MMTGIPVATLALAALVALAVDRWCGEPPVRLHPVVWMGQMLHRLGQWAAPPAQGGSEAQRGAAVLSPEVARHAWLRGVLGWWAVALPVVALAGLLQVGVLWLAGRWAEHGLPGASLWSVLLLGLLCKPLLSWRMLHDEVADVERALGVSTEAGRLQLARLVSRDVRGLDAAAVRGAALSSLAENLNDSVVAPLFWFLVAGLPGAACYRLANTADAMWGYYGVRGARVWSDAGHWAARTDDVLSWLPARLTALMLLPRPGQGVRACLRRLPGEARQTPSPNGGWPMGALALALNLRLEKAGAYCLNSAGRPPAASDTRAALRHCARSIHGLAMLLAIVPAVSVLPLLP